MDRINLQNKAGRTALHLSLLESDSLTKALLENGYDPHIRDNNGLSVFDYCIPIEPAWARPWTCSALEEYFPDEYARIKENKTEGEKL